MVVFKFIIMLDFVFVVLVYRNTSDLKDFFNNFAIERSKVVVVNSFYDVETEKEFQEIAKMYNADFLSVENRGYGAGNNLGIAYALKSYKFQYLVISNADIVIKNFLSALDLPKKAIIAPDIRNVLGKKQNPHLYCAGKLFDKIQYFARVKHISLLMFLLRIYSRLSREILCILVSIFRKSKVLIYAPHGSFFIISEDALLKLTPLFNEDMFLFCEESHVANLARKNKIPIVFMPEIKILHKEDGSMKFVSDSINKIANNSYMAYYNYWYQK